MRRIRLLDRDLAGDPADPEGFRALSARIGPGVGAERTGATLDELPPGQAVCPHQVGPEGAHQILSTGRPADRLIVERSGGVGDYRGEVEPRLPE